MKVSTDPSPGLFKLDGSARPLDELTCSLDDLAYLFGTSKANVMKLARDGSLPKQSRDRYRLAACVKAQFERKGSHSGEEPPAIVESRTKLYDTQRAKHELEMQQLRKELLPAEEVATAIRAMFGIIATQLDGLGPRMAARLAGMSDAQLIAKDLLNECRNMRRAMAEAVGEYAHDLADESPPRKPRKAAR